MPSLSPSRRISRIGAGLAAGTGGAGLAFWLAGQAASRSWAPLLQIPVLSALSLTLAGAALAAKAQAAGAWKRWGVILLGLAAGGTALCGADSSRPPLTVAALALVGLALIVSERPVRAGRDLLAWTAPLALAAALAALAINVFRIYPGANDASPGAGARTLIAILIDLGASIAAGSVLVARPDFAFVEAFLLDSTASRRARHMLPAFLFGPPVLAGLHSLLIQGGVETAEPIFGIAAAAYLLLLLALVAGIVRSAAAPERAKIDSEAVTHRLVADLRSEAASLLHQIAQRTRELEVADASLKAATHANVRLALVARHTHNGVIVADDRGIVLWQNPAWESLSGRPPSPPDSRSVAHELALEGEAAEFMTKLVESGEAGEFETQYNARNGRSYWLSVTVRPVRDPAQGAAHFIVVLTDITAYREAERRLHGSNERLEFALRSSGFGIWEMNPASNRIEWDERMYQIYGLSPGDFPGDVGSFQKLLHPADRAIVAIHRGQVLSGELNKYEIDFRIVRPDGEIRTLEAHGFVERDAAGRALRLVGLNRDITSRKVLEERLRHSEEISIHVSRLAQIGAWEQIIATRQVTWSSELFRLCEVELGYAPSSESLAGFFPEAEQRIFEQAIAQAMLDGRPFDLESAFVTARGRRRWVRVIGQAEFKDGSAVRIFGALQEITAQHDAEGAQRKLESQLFQVQKMETLGTLAGGIAHDFNNLLTGIMGYQDLALDTLPEGDPARHCLAESHKASLRARDLVDQILTFSRQSAGGERLPIDLAPVVEEARRFLRSTVPATIQIEIEIIPNCGHVLADEAQVHQLLLNLGTNGAHAMRGAGGVLKISLAPARLDTIKAATIGSLSAGAFVRLSVSDTGHGIDADTKKRIFDPFFTTKGVGEGTGLGLAVVHGIARSHGGGIEVDSTPGQGTRFDVYLPMVQAAAEEVSTRAEPVPLGHGEMICIVDDEDFVAQVTRAGLERLGYRAIVFDDAQACLEALRRDPQGCTLLFTDQTMPGMTGLELAAAVREFAPAMPILIMSGYFSAVSAAALDKLGNIALLAKPFTMQELGRQMSRSLHGEPVKIDA